MHPNTTKTTEHNEQYLAYGDRADGVRDNIDMSFYHGTIDKDTLRTIIAITNKELRYTHGLGYRGPTINKILITKDRAIELLDELMLSVHETDDFILFNTYSTNDMF